MTLESTEIIKKIILDILNAIGVDATIEVEDSITKGLVLNIQALDSYMLIGRQGAHLHALQTLAQAIAGKRLRGQDYPVFMVDVDDYKRKREWFLRETAKQAVERCKRVGKAIALDPMPNFERKLVHAYIQENFPEVSSASIGFEPRRRVVIRIRQ